MSLQNIHFINVHASLLPKWRGAAPIQRAILNMDKETGISIMKIVPELDAGPVLLNSKIKITEDTNYGELSYKMSLLGAKLILDALKLFDENKLNFIEQDKLKATYAKKIDKTETKIDWKQEANKIIAKINAFQPSPGCWFQISGERFKVIKAKEVNLSGKPGFLINNELTIACLRNAIQILELQKEGKQKVNAKEFLKGNIIKAGQNLN